MWKMWLKPPGTAHLPWRMNCIWGSCCDSHSTGLCKLFNSLHFNEHDLNSVWSQLVCSCVWKVKIIGEDNHLRPAWNWVAFVIIRRQIGFKIDLLILRCVTGNKDRCKETPYLHLYQNTFSHFAAQHTDFRFGVNGAWGIVISHHEYKVQS